MVTELAEVWFRQETKMTPKQKQHIKVTNELPETPADPEQYYSFRKVRKLLKGIKGDMSQEIIAERGIFCDSESTNMKDNLVTPDKARELLRGSGKGENLCEKLLKSRKEDLIWG